MSKSKFYKLAQDSIESIYRFTCPLCEDTIESKNGCLAQAFKLELFRKGVRLAEENDGVRGVFCSDCIEEYNLKIIK